MARIRSIHSNTLIDPEFAALPVEARLMFIYSWTAADDAGNLEGNPLGLRMALFPADEWATVARITELREILIAGRFYESYEADGKRYLHIRTFDKYQKPERKTKHRCPLRPGQNHEYRVRDGKEWIRKTATGAVSEQTPIEQCANSVHSLGSGLGLGVDLDLDRTGEDARVEKTANPRTMNPCEAATSDSSPLLRSDADTDSPPKDLSDNPLEGTDPEPPEFNIEAAINAALAGGDASPAPAVEPTPAPSYEVTPDGYRIH
jgi:hypothetical protein